MKTVIALVLASSLAGCAAVATPGGSMSRHMSHGGMQGMQGMGGMQGKQGGMQGMAGMQGKEGTAVFGAQARAGAGGGMCGGQGAQGGGGMCGGNQAKEGSGMQGMMQQRMDAMDTDGDGMLSRDEFMKAQVAMFDAMPKNPQGLVEAKQMSGCPMMMGSMGSMGSMRR